MRGFGTVSLSHEQTYPKVHGLGTEVRGLRAKRRGVETRIHASFGQSTLPHERADPKEHGLGTEMCGLGT